MCNPLGGCVGHDDRVGSYPVEPIGDDHRSFWATAVIEPEELGIRHGSRRSQPIGAEYVSGGCPQAAEMALAYGIMRSAEAERAEEHHVLAVVGIIIVVFFWRLLVLRGVEVFERAGLVPAAAVLEARSALTDSGYTTSETEVVANDAASRPVASLLVIVGFVGPVTFLDCWASASSSRHQRTSGSVRLCLSS